ncbi:PREDICTED: SNF2 domain-containing protein CLASSY 3 [Tarenaya hassleriana]|uniref:SNF2 domain-containing protein CLASSY 3 n=1 Tax=Tarenaya hassleriana TaxID=28532 RepID=UPI00053C2B05|nr:PREDICTED: SNF2 domain-containing protein CLASSY 3 [Tarenaya hassleriana]
MAESESSKILSSSSSSSSSSDDYDHHFHQEKVGITNVASTSKKPMQTERKSRGKDKKYEKRVEQKPQKEEKRVAKQYKNIVFTCGKCGSTASTVAGCDNSPTQTVEAAGGGLNKLPSPKASRIKESVSDRRSEILPPGPRAADENSNKPVSTDVARAKDSVSIGSNRKAENPLTGTRADEEELTKVASANASRAEDSVSVGSERKYGKQQLKTEIEHCPKSSGHRTKELDVFSILVNSVWGKQRIGEEEPGSSPRQEEPQEQEETRGEDKYDADGFLVVQPPPLVLNFKFGEDEPEPEIPEWEIENQQLFDEFALLLKSGETEIDISSDITKESAVDEHPLARCEKGNHELELDLEIGLKCIHCGFIETEIRHMDVSEWRGDIFNSRRRSAGGTEREDKTFFEKLGFPVLTKNSSTECGGESDGTVWDVIPGTKSQLYPHQQEGFEFIWRNIAGTIHRDKLDDYEKSDDENRGCIISHAPGTGKTRLTIVFLQSYMELHNNCRPMIIAPASLLLTWEEEFKKWNMDVPFHNLNNVDFSGNESSVAMDIFEKRGQGSRSHNDVRMVKLFSWSTEKSILGISYNLFEKLAGDDVEKRKKKKKSEAILDKEREDIRKILLEIPGLLVLDEAHTPRSQRSCIWKTLTKVTTQKRILLSGTPFQNSFLELCNVLCVARPAYLSKFSSMLKKSKMTVLRRRRRKDGRDSASAVHINNDGIDELKSLMDPFVHVHKGSILQKSLLGLRDCVVVLNPPALQKRILESIPNSKNVFEVDHKRSVVSIHPSLISCCTLSKEELLVLDETLLDQLKRSRLEPNESVKTRFLMEFIGLCNAVNERVLVFSQYIDPLSLIMEQLGCVFNWLEGKEVLYLHGKLEQNQRQLLINKFNDPKSEARVILASIKACSEGINLVGASRVVLLDVVWNPAVERQAISRAYRIGQKRVVYTYHLVMKGSLECQKYCQQAEKHRISELMFSSRHEKAKSKSCSEAVLEDKVLDQMVQHAKLGEMFEKLIYQPKEADLVESFNSVFP